MTPTRTTGPKKGKTLTAPQALATTPLAMFATVYAACADRGVSVLEVEEMEVWQVASTLGVDMTDDHPTGTAPSGPPPPGSLSRGRAAAMARAKAN